MMLGLSQKRALLLADAGRAFALAPDLEEEVRSFGVTIEAAAALARILGDQRFKAEAEKWRTLAREKTPVSNEVVVELVLDYFLDREDPANVQPGKRRKGSTVNDPSRAIPAEVKRNILAKRGRKCQGGGCENHLHLCFCHIKSHAEGGSREEDNLFLDCWLCHWLYDHGLITISGTADNPVFRNRNGDILGQPRPPP